MTSLLESNWIFGLLVIALLIVIVSLGAMVEREEQAMRQMREPEDNSNQDASRDTSRNTPENTPENNDQSNAATTSPEQQTDAAAKTDLPDQHQ